MREVKSLRSGGCGAEAIKDLEEVMEADDLSPKAAAAARPALSLARSHSGGPYAP